MGQFYGCGPINAGQRAGLYPRKFDLSRKSSHTQFNQVHSVVRASPTPSAFRHLNHGRRSPSRSRTNARWIRWTRPRWRQRWQRPWTRPTRTKTGRREGMGSCYKTWSSCARRENQVNGGMYSTMSSCAGLTCRKSTYILCPSRNTRLSTISSPNSRMKS